MKKIFLIICVIGLLLIATTSIGYCLDANLIMENIDRNLNPYSFEGYRKVINEEPNGNKKEYLFYFVKKGRDKIALVYIEPAGERGKASLRVGDNMWLYIKEAGKPIRLSSQQSLTGGVFNNADLLKIDFTAEYTAVILMENEQQYTLELKAKNSSVIYDKVVMLVDKRTILPLKMDCYSVSGMLIKTLEYKVVKDFGNGLTAPSVIVTTGPLYPGYKSTMIYLSTKPRLFPDEVFTLNYMSKLEGLRK